jgi:hypothetical protein
MLDQPFYDDVHRWTFATKNSLSRVAGPIDSELLNYRRLIRGAHRFVIDDSMLSHLVHLSNTPEQHQFNYWSILARLPYDVMWVEWDQLERLRLSDALGKLSFPVIPEEVSQSHGLLLVRDLESTAKWAAYAFAKDSTGELFVNPLVMVFDPDGVWNNPLSDEGAVYELSDMAGMGVRAVSAMGQPPLHEALNFGHGLEFVALGYLGKDRVGHDAPNWAVNKIGVIEEPIWRKFRLQRQKRGVPHQVLVEPYVEQAHETRGLIRTVIALLALLNNVPKIINDVPAKQGYRSVKHNRVSYLDHHTVSLTLPKTRQLEYIQQRLRLGYGRYRRHDVRGFYRRVTNDRLGIRCHHIPTPESTSEHIICGRCGSQIRWVNEFQRGDASLGHVQKTYKLKAPHAD